jgi:2-methylcitrate dehydratase PrpD
MIAGALAGGVTRLFEAGLPDAVRVATTRSLLNVVGTAVGACRHPAVDVVVEAALAYGAAPAASVPGRAERLDAPSAALATGVAAHLDDFDDTHLATVVHPTASVLSAALPTVSAQDVPGGRLVDAAALGIEAQLRVATAMSPEHYDAGWHITGTVGVVGAAVTAGLLLGLDDERLGTAVGLAASMTLGHREGFGTMVKPFHPGKAAANGMLAAALARRGFTASATALEGPRGYFAAMTPRVEVDSVVAGLGERWELLDNTVKPYPCGIVSHPAIEAAERLSPRLDGATPLAVRVRCHPLVVELTGDRAPADGLAARFSTVHGVAAGLADGTVGLAQYEDERVRAPDLVSLRDSITLLPDDQVARDAAEVEVDLAGGRTLRETVEHARGSLSRPLTDAELDAKVTTLVDRTWPGQAAEILQAVRGLAEAGSCTPLLDAISRKGQ